jgi:hypothetical protein
LTSAWLRARGRRDQPVRAVLIIESDKLAMARGLERLPR